MVIVMKSIKIMFGERLRNLREIKDMTQETVSGELSISRGMLSNYELGKREPDYAMLCRLADYYHVTTDYLLGVTSLPQNQEYLSEKRLQNIVNYYLTCPEESRQDLEKYAELLSLRDEKKKNYKKQNI